MNIKPISPDEIVVELPDYVIVATNEMIKSKYRGSEFSFKQTELLDMILKHAPEGTTSRFLFDNKYLDIEKLYESYGWKVEYDRPAYNEDYPATFTFSKKKS